MLIYALPLGIPATICAARVKPSLANGDVAAAQKASRNVKILFWIAVAIWVVVIIAIAAANGSNSQG